MVHPIQKPAIRCLTICAAACAAPMAFAADPLEPAPAWATEIDKVAAAIGYEVAGAGDVNGDGVGDVIVGSPGYWASGGPSGSQHGAVFVYHGSSSGLSASFDWSAIGPNQLAGYGTGVGTAGDVNGDGFDDVIYTANFMGIAPKALVHHGSADGLSPSPDWSFDFAQNVSTWGIPAVSAGDVNGDGFDDVILGAPLFDNGHTDEGRAWVFHGSAGGLSSQPDWSVEGDATDAQLGFSVCSAGDVNDDGYDDVIVASLIESTVYHGAPAGLDTTAAWTGPMVSFDSGGYCRGQVASAGDVNGDGYADVIVGAAGIDEALVFHGSASGLSETASWSAAGEGLFGCSVASAGDVDADGYADVIVGERAAGRALVYLGSSEGLSTTSSWSADLTGWFGHSVASAGDVNSDGRIDVIVGAPQYDEIAVGAGKAFLYLGTTPAVSGPAGAVSDGSIVAEEPLRLELLPDGTIGLSWSLSCNGSDADYAVYEGTLGDYSHRTARMCTTGGSTATTLDPGEGDRYYLVAPLSADSEGSHGLDASGEEREPFSPTCYPQAIADCSEPL